MISGVEFSGFEEIKSRYSYANILPAAKAAAFATGQEAKNFLQEYPPATAANRPGRWTHPAEGQPRPMGFYERGRGEWYPIIRKATLASGSFGHYGKASGRIKARGVEAKAGLIAGYKLIASSERLREKWTVVREPNGVVVTNAAMYAPWVQGGKSQARVMAAIGWRTTKQCVEYLMHNQIFQIAFYQALKARLAVRTNVTRTVG